MEKCPGHGLCPDLSGPGRPARSMHIPARASSCTELPYLAISSLKIAHWSILPRGTEGHGGDLDENGCSTCRKWVLRWTLTGVLRVSREIRFYLHKEFRAAEIGFSLHKELYEIFGGRPCRKWLFAKCKIGQRWRIFGFFNEGWKQG